MKRGQGAGALTRKAQAMLATHSKQAPLLPTRCYTRALAFLITHPLQPLATPINPSPPKTQEYEVDFVSLSYTC